MAMGLTLEQAEIVDVYRRGKEAGLIPEESVVVGGAAMVMLGI